MNRKTWFAGVVASLVCAPLLAACSNSDSAAGDSQPSPGAANVFAGLSKVDALAAKLPPDIKASGVIRVASDETYPPFEFVNHDGEVVGLDPDLGKAIGILLGVEVKFINTSFDAIIPALAAKKVDMAMSSIGDSKEREKTVDYATYYHNVSAVLVKEGNPKDIKATLTCGARIGAVRGSLQQTVFLPTQAKKCKADGKPAPVIGAYQSGPQAQLALQSGRLDGVMEDYPPLRAVIASQPQKFDIAGPVFRVPDPGGVAFPKGSQLVEPVHDALNLLIRKGTYKKIFKKWDMSIVAIKKSQINGAVS